MSGVTSKAGSEGIPSGTQVTGSRSHWGSLDTLTELGRKHSHNSIIQSKVANEESKSKPSVVKFEDVLTCDQKNLSSTDIGDILENKESSLLSSATISGIKSSGSQNEHLKTSETLLEYDEKLTNNFKFETKNESPQEQLLKYPDYENHDDMNMAKISPEKHINVSTEPQIPNESAVLAQSQVDLNYLSEKSHDISKNNNFSNIDDILSVPKELNSNSEVSAFPSEIPTPNQNNGVSSQVDFNNYQEKYYQDGLELIKNGWKSPEDNNFIELYSSESENPSSEIEDNDKDMSPDNILQNYTSDDFENELSDCGSLESNINDSHESQGSTDYKHTNTINKINLGNIANLNNNIGKNEKPINTISTRVNSEKDDPDMYSDMNSYEVKECFQNVEDHSEPSESETCNSDDLFKGLRDITLIPLGSSSLVFFKDEDGTDVLQIFKNA